MTTLSIPGRGLSELRAEWREAAGTFWAVVRDRQHGRASQHDLRCAGEAAQRAQERYREARGLALSGQSSDPTPDRFLARLSLKLSAPQLADSQGVWAYVETLRREAWDAVRDLSRACADLSHAPRGLGPLVVEAEKAHDRWRTAYDLALHEHPLVGRAEVAGARIGGESRLRPEDWSDSTVGRFRFEAATGAHKLATVSPEEREQVIVRAITRAVPELETNAVPFLFCARPEGERLCVDVYVPEGHATSLFPRGGEQGREAVFLREFHGQVDGLAHGTELEHGRQGQVAAREAGLHQSSTTLSARPTEMSTLPGFEPGQTLLKAGRPTLEADRSVAELARGAAAFTTAFSQDPQKIASASRLAVSVGGPAIEAAKSIAQVPANIIRRE